MKKFTWNDLQERISKMDEKQRESQVCVSIEDDSYFRDVKDIDFISDDIYVHIEDTDEMGTLKDLKCVEGDDFDIENYKLITPKGTPFLWDGL